MSTTDLIGFRLSPEQRRLWTWQSGGDADARTWTCSVRIQITGDADAEWLRAALRRIATRHENLRTRLHALAGVAVPVQVIEPAIDVRFTEHDLRGCPPGRRDRLLAWADTAWDLASPSAAASSRCGQWRARLLRTGDRAWTLSLAAPSMLMDRTSMACLYTELVRALAVEEHGEAASDASGDVLQYADISEWRNTLLEGEEGRAAAAFWRDEHLTDRLPRALPFECPSPSAATFRPAHVMGDVSPSIAEACRELCGQSGADWRLPWLAAWQIVIGRVAATATPVLGLLDDGRLYPELEGALGLLARFRPCVVELHPESTFRELLRGAAAVALQGDRWTEYFSWHDLDARQYFPYTFEAIAHPEPATIARMRLSLDRLDACHDRFKICLAVDRAVDAWRTRWAYDAALFARDDIERLAGQVGAVLRTAASHPTATIAEIAARSARELPQRTASAPANLARCAARRDRRRTRREPLLAFDRIRAAAAAFGSRIALACGEETLTYAALDERATRLARRLRALGVERDDLVAVHAGRSIASVIAFLAAWRAGAAFLPLDTAWPDARLTQVLADARPKAIVSRGRLRDEPAGAVVLDLDADRIDAGAALDEHRNHVGNDLPGPLPANVAYVIYTSGSSGAPKGVAIEHRQIANYVGALIDVLRPSPGAVFATVSTFAADLGHTMIFPCLATGGCLVIVPLDAALSPQAFTAALGGRRADYLKIVPAHLAGLLGVHRERPVTTDDEAILPRRRLVLGGDRCPRDLYRHLRDRGIVVMNHYGPTETTVGVLTYGRDAVDLRCVSVPLGLPLLRSAVYVLDADMHPVDIWSPGQLFIGGDGVGRGYLGRPGLTAERFVPDPFSARPGARLYRTGDIGRRLPGDSIEFLHRADDQVKIRGHRIELAEIEAALVAHAGVAAAVVMASAPRDDEERSLMAFVVSAMDALKTEELEIALRQQLPPAMVPQQWILLSELPLGANGKIDRARLLFLAERERARAAAAPDFHTPIQDVLAGLWCDLLRVGSASLADDFFDLGGHSLLLTRLIARVREAFGVELGFRAILEHSTLQAMALAIEVLRRQGTADRPLERRSEDDQTPAPLTSAQERVWFLEQFDPGGPANNVSFVAAVREPVSHTALRQALHSVIQRHASLRTAYVASGGRVSARALPDVAIDVLVVDLRCVAADRHRRAREVVRAHGRVGFALERGAVLRTVVCTLDEQASWLGFTVHHIAFDAWSRRIFVDDLARAYRACASGQLAAARPLAIRYRDYAWWEQQRRGRLDADLAFWKTHLAGSPPTLALPVDRPYAAIRDASGATRRSWIAPAVTARLRALSRREHGTLFMTLLAGFQCLLSRITGQDDLLVATPFTNRGQPGTEHLIGLFLNTVVTRARFERATTFRDHVRAVRRDLLDAHDRHVPFEKLIDAIDPPRERARPPLAQALFIHHAPEAASDEPRAIAFEPVEVDLGVSRFELTLSVRERTDDLEVAIEYPTALFDAATIDRLGTQYARLLEAAADRPDLEVYLLPLSTPRELEARLGNARCAFAVDDTDLVHDRIAAQARRAPSAVAIECGDEAIAYGEFALRVDRLARRLRASGVGPERLVGVHVAPSIDLVTGLLAVLAAGGAYVPLSASLPAAQMVARIEHAQPMLLLTRTRDAAEVSAATTLPIVFMDRPEDGPRHDGAVPAMHPEHLAYVMYTSGSTGEPKGVQVSHGALTNVLESFRVQLGITPADRWVSATAITFDIAALELFLPLICGATLVVIDEQARHRPERLRHAIERARPTVLQLTPSGWRFVIGAGWQGENGLTALAGGERLSEELAGELSRRASTVWHVYGPTETTIWSAAHRLSPDDQTLVIGAPIAKTGLYVLDRGRQLGPEGVVGELFISGAGLARGYLGRPDLTADRFLPCPFEGPGMRMYRTGDRVRVRPGGGLEFVGRADGQVKLRGVRVELGEVEAAVRAWADVSDAVAILLDDGAGDARLIACVEAVPGATLDTTALRAFVARRLPASMRPARYVCVDAFPLTINGKVDRAALARRISREAPRDEALARGDAAAGADAIPSDGMLPIVASVFAEVLAVERVSPNDDFFTLGGHSLLATQIVARLAERVHAHVPLSLVFEHPTVVALAQALDRQLVAHGSLAHALPLSSAAVSSPLASGVSTTRELLLSFAQQEVWSFEQIEPGTATYNMTRLLRLRGALDLTALDRAVQALIARHDMLRASVHATAGRPSMQVASRAALAIPIVDLTALPREGSDETVRAICRADLKEPFDLTRAPLARCRVLRFNPAHHVVVITVHHLVADAWSFGIMAREVAASYAAASAASAGVASGAEATAPIASYVDHIQRERESWANGRFREGLDYWTRRLSGVSTRAFTPAVRRVPGLARRGTAEACAIRLGRDLSEAVRRVATAEHVTPFMVFLAAYTLLLCGASGDEEVVIGTDVAGRPDRSSEDVVGLYVNQIALRTSIAGDPTVRALLGRVRDVTLEGFAHQHVPFERVVGALRPRRQRGEFPLFQTKLVLQQFPTMSQPLAGLQVESIEFYSDNSRFHLMLTLWVRDGEFHGQFNYNTGIVDATGVQQLASQYRAILGLVASRLDLSVSGVRASLDEDARQARASLSERFRTSRQHRLRTSVARPIAPTVH